MSDALGMYLLIKAEHEAVLREFAERERFRGFPRTARARLRPLRAAAVLVRRVRRSAGSDAASTAS